MRSFLVLLILFSAMAAKATTSSSWSILWVLDNSGSMQAQRAQLAKGAPEFLRRLKASGVTDFRMAVTTTDVISGEGRLVAGPNGLKVVGAAGGETAFEGLLSGVTDSPSSFWEQGLEGAYLAIQKEGGAFLKDGEPLAVIYVSDEDDYSCEKDCFGVEPENNKNWTPYPLERYKLLFSELKSKRNIDTLLFPIVGILEGSCDWKSYGVRYLKVLSQVGGLSGSACGVDFVNSLFAVADRIGKFGPAPVLPKLLVDPVVLPAAPVSWFYTSDLSPFVQGTGKLTFAKLGGPAWLSIGADGSVQGRPLPADTGENYFTASVKNEKGIGVDFQVTITVGHGNSPPIWSINPIPLASARVNQVFRADLAPFVSDPDGDPLQCRALSLPSWLVFEPSCVLSGTPRAADTGKFSVAVQVSDGKSTAMGFAAGRVVAR